MPYVDIDGDLADWNPNRLQYVDHMVHGSGELDAAFQMGWNWGGLLIGVSVADDAHRTPGRISSNFKNDGIELLLDTKLSEDFSTAYNNNDDYQIVIDIDGDAYRYYPRNQEGVVSVIANFLRYRTEYTGEILIPWESLGISQRDVAVGLVYGFNLAINDNDSTSPNLQRMIATSPNRSSQEDPTRWGTLTLVGSDAGIGNTLNPVYVCPHTYPSSLSRWTTARITYDPPKSNRVRELPSRWGRQVGSLQVGENLLVLDGPVCADGWIWWWVQSLETGLKGWTSEGGDGQTWVEPTFSATGLLNPDSQIGGFLFCEELDYSQPSCTRGFTTFSGNIQKIYNSWNLYNIPAGTIIQRRYTFYGDDGTRWTWNSPSGRGERVGTYIEYEQRNTFFDAQAPTPNSPYYGDGTYMKPGWYQIELLLNGAVVQQGEFILR